MAKILFLVRSATPYFSNRRDLDGLMKEFREVGHEVYVYDSKKRLLINTNTNYRKVSLKFFRFFDKSIFSFPFRIISLWIFCIRHRNHFDVVQISYVQEEYLILPKAISNLGRKIFIFIYGSDVNDKNFLNKNFYRLYRYSDKIIIGNKSLSDKFIDDLPARKKNVSEKIINLFMPVDHLNLYNNFTFQKKSEFKKKLNITDDKTVIILGSNSYANEQHELMIEQLNKLPDLNQFVFLIPFSNRAVKDLKRENKIRELLGKNPNLHFIIYTDYLSYEKMASLRMASDIFINFRRIDQLTLSMIESNMSYCQVITGSWLPYKDYINATNIKVISEPNELCEAIANVISDLNIKAKLEHNRNYAKELFLKDMIRPWLELYSIDD